MEGFKEMLKGKKGKFFLIALGVVAVLGLYMMNRKKNNTSGTATVTSYPLAVDPNKSGSGGSGSGGTSAGGVTANDVVSLLKSYSTTVDAQIKKQQDQNQSLSGAFNGALAGQQSGFNQQFAGLQGNIADLTKQLNDGLQKSATSTMSTSYQQPTYDHEDHTVYSSSNPSAINAATTSSSPQYGYGGGNYNTGSEAVRTSIAANEHRLATDSKFVESEKVRTEQVIQNRQSAGLDTSEQVAYRDKLKSA